MKSEIMLSDDEILDSISEHTTEIKRGLWLRQIKYNRKHYGFGSVLTDEEISQYSGRKALVLAAGPGFKRFGMGDLRKVAGATPVIVACDGALPTLAGLGIRPDFVVSVDAHPIVANFYRRSRNILDGTTVLLSTTINKDVVEECKGAGAKVRWIQGFFKEQDQFYAPGVTSVNSGGNVGTTCFMLAAFKLKCRPIGLMGIEFAWSDETPYNETQYYEQLQRIVGTENVPAYFKHIKNYRDGKTYIADPVYYTYLIMFREIWESMLPEDVKATTYNLTRQGILSAPGLTTLRVEEFLKL